MSYPGRGTRRLGIAFLIALVGAALAPAAASADQVTFAGGSGPEFDQFINIFPNTTEKQKVGVVISYEGSEHLMAGSDVTLSPGPQDPGFTADDVTFTVPSD